MTGPPATIAAPSGARLEALDVIGRWAEEAAVTLRHDVAAPTFRDHDDGTREDMEDFRNALYLMRHDIVAGIPQTVLALTTGGGVDDVQAIAAVTQSVTAVQGIGPRRRHVRVRGVVAKPTGDRRRSIAELLRKIRDYASGAAVTMSSGSEVEEYYRSLGYTAEDMATLSGNHERDGLNGASSLDGLKMTRLTFEDGVRPVRAPFPAAALINKWTEDAAAVEAESATNNDDRTQQLMRDTQSILHRMRDDVTGGVPAYVLALTSGGRAEDIQAIAIVSTQVSGDSESGAGSGEALEIRAAVAKPTARGQQQAVPELARRIRGWAAGRPLTVALDAATGGYYGRIGFEPKEVVGPDAAGGEGGPEPPPGADALQVLALDLERDVAPAADTPPGEASGSEGSSMVALSFGDDFLPVRAPLMAVTVVDRWLAGADRVSADTPFDWSTQQLMQDTRAALETVRGKILEGVPELVLAFATGESVEDVQAIATVTTQKVLDTSAGVRTDVVEIREILANPTTREPRRHIAELVRRIHVWADGRFVTISRGKALSRYYGRLGYELRDMRWPDMVYRTYGSEEPLLHGEGHRMLALELGTDLAPAPVPWKAADVVGAWRARATSLIARAADRGDLTTERELRGVQRVLEEIDRTVAEGGPEYVFALATGDRPEDIRAVATVGVRAGAAGGGREAVSVHEVVAGPPGDEDDRGGVARLIRRVRSTASGHRHVAALIRWIHVWAEGRSVTISQVKGLTDDYYASLGFEPEDMVLPVLSYGRCELERSLSGLQFRVVALELDAGPTPVQVHPTALV